MSRSEAMASPRRAAALGPGLSLTGHGVPAKISFLEFIPQSEFDTNAADPATSHKQCFWTG